MNFNLQLFVNTCWIENKSLFIKKTVINLIVVACDVLIGSIRFAANEELLKAFGSAKEGNVRLIKILIEKGKWHYLNEWFLFKLKLVHLKRIDPKSLGSESLDFKFSFADVQYPENIFWILIFSIIKLWVLQDA